MSAHTYMTRRLFPLAIVFAAVSATPEATAAAREGGEMDSGTRNAKLALEVAPAKTPYIDAQRLDMEALLQELKADPQNSYRPGEAGGLGALLAGTGTRTFLHMIAAVSARYASDHPEVGFRPIHTKLDEFEVLAGASILGRLRPELRLNADPLRLRVEVAQVDLKATDWLVLQSGLFVVPVGAVNEYFFPEYLSLLPRVGVSEVFSRLIPVKWSGLGFQMRGRRQLAADHSVNYAVFAISEQYLDEERLVESGRLPEATGPRSGGAVHPLDEHGGGGFAYGGRLGYGWADWLQVGVSVFSGSHYLDSHRGILLDTDALVRLGQLEFRTENVLVLHESHRLWGVTGSLGYRVTPWLQPAIGAEWFETETLVAGGGSIIMAAVNLRPLPAYGHLILRLGGSQKSRRDTGEHSFSGLLQLAGGF